MPRRRCHPVRCRVPPLICPPLVGVTPSPAVWVPRQPAEDGLWPPGVLIPGGHDAPSTARVALWHPGSQGTWSAQNVPTLGTRLSCRWHGGRSHRKPGRRCWARLRRADVPFLPARSLPAPWFAQGRKCQERAGVNGASPAALLKTLSGGRRELWELLSATCLRCQHRAWPQMIGVPGDASNGAWHGTPPQPCFAGQGALPNPFQSPQTLLIPPQPPALSLPGFRMGKLLAACGPQTPTHVLPPRLSLGCSPPADERRQDRR